MALTVAHIRPPHRDDPIPFDLVLLSWNERQKPPRRVECIHGDQLALDCSAHIIQSGDRLILSDGRNVEVIACEEALTEITGPLRAVRKLLDRRGTSFQDEHLRVLILRDAGAEAELTALGATLRPVMEQFAPARMTPEETNR